MPDPEFLFRSKFGIYIFVAGACSLHFSIFGPMELLHYFLAFGIFQGIFLIIVIAMTDQHKSGRWLLMLLIGCLVLRLAEFLAMQLGIYQLLPHIIFATVPLLLFVGPLIYFYLQQLLYSEFRFESKKDLLHLLPFLFAIALLMDFYLTPSGGKLFYVRGLTNGQVSTRQILYFILFFTQFHAYLFLSLKIIGRYAADFKAQRSDPAFLKVVWVKRLLYSVMIFTGMYVLTYLFLFFKNAYYPVVEHLAFVAIVLAIHLIFVYYLKYKFGAFKGVKIQKPKYYSSSLSQHDITVLLQKLKQIMEEQRPYLETDLRINKLAEILDIPVPHVSQVINEGAGMSFYDFVNAYRIERAKQLLFDPNYAQYTMLAVAHDSGFSNKTTFNRTFKKHVGMAPSTFVKTSKK